MRYSASEKLEIIGLVEHSAIGVKRTLAQLGIPKSTFYNWYGRYLEGGLRSLEDRKPMPGHVWNKISDSVKEDVVNFALEIPELSPRELAVRYTDEKNYYISESSVYRILKSHDLITSPAFIVMKAKDKFDQPTTAPNQLWQTDFTYFKIIGWGWYYLSTVLDDYSRYILSWRLCTTMSATDVTETLQDALDSSGLKSMRVNHKPRLLSDNGPCYVSSELAHWLGEQGMNHTRGKPYHPMTQGKIERYHRTMKNQILLENYYLPSELEAKLDAFVTYYNERRYHESLNNLTPKDVYFGRAETVLRKRDKIKQKTMLLRKKLHDEQKAV